MCLNHNQTLASTILSRRQNVRMFSLMLCLFSAAFSCYEKTAKKFTWQQNIAVWMGKLRKFNPVMGGCTLLLMLMFWAVLAHAEEYEDYFQITCRPESNYFAMRTLRLQVPDCKVYKKCNVKDSDDQNSRLLNPNQFLDNPYICKLQNNVLAVKLINYRAAKGRGMCGGISHFDITILINNREVHEFNAYGYNRCEHAETHLVEFWSQSDSLRDCTLPDDPRVPPVCHGNNSVSGDKSRQNVRARTE